ncbi:putative 2OG-Fe(II) oxygenase family oxidoreductase [Neospora caninum Liverpool]|uniref:Putative 2OG-Fe(II) oxygenase family oxidoreductase n=1 Tax=Neospora caninum (strain Liverpool) TaxID=572307 RepID=F0VGV5_NEOCL|nr:putative 2OG-Fe(II) oxygenase family oxidoreductase [Neospora caninum Liverpool]CBZ52949.1 putative 2OG-Fe(II) oxygenase family oxidoreductase [Neospora caninum Liverpool]|eukprot:XP_003882981.1 putative 2OG-Fe(II) oxygenase family oxidoreductase [Neospora caninum Liverpool]
MEVFALIVFACLLLFTKANCWAVPPPAADSYPLPQAPYGAVEAPPDSPHLRVDSEARTAWPSAHSDFSLNLVCGFGQHLLFESVASRKVLSRPQTRSVCESATRGAFERPRRLARSAKSEVRIALYTSQKAGPEALARRAAAAEFAAIQRWRPTAKRRLSSTKKQKCETKGSEKPRASSASSGPPAGAFGQEKCHRLRRPKPSELRLQSSPGLSPTAAAATALARALAAAAAPVERALATSDLFAGLEGDSERDGKKPQGRQRTAKRGARPQNSAAFQKLTRSSATLKKKRSSSIGTGGPTSNCELPRLASSLSDLSAAKPASPRAAPKPTSRWQRGATAGARKTKTDGTQASAAAAAVAATAALAAAAALLENSTGGSACDSLCTDEKLAEAVRTCVASLEGISPLPPCAGKCAVHGKSKPTAISAVLSAVQAAGKSAEVALLRLQDGRFSPPPHLPKQAAGSWEGPAQAAVSARKAAVADRIAEEPTHAGVSRKKAFSNGLDRLHTTCNAERRPNHEGSGTSQLKRVKGERPGEAMEAEKGDRNTSVALSRQGSRKATSAAHAAAQTAKAVAAVAAVAASVEPRRRRRGVQSRVPKKADSASEESERDSSVSPRESARSSSDGAEEKASRVRQQEGGSEERGEHERSSPSEDESSERDLETDSDVESPRRARSALWSETGAGRQGNEDPASASSRAGAGGNVMSAEKREDEERRDENESAESLHGVASASATDPLNAAQEPAGSRPPAPSRVAVSSKPSRLCSEAGGAETPAKEAFDETRKQNLESLADTAHDGAGGSKREEEGTEGGKGGKTKGTRRNSREARFPEGADPSDRDALPKPGAQDDATQATETSGLGKSSFAAGTIPTGDTLREGGPVSTKRPKKKKKEGNFHGEAHEAPSPARASPASTSLCQTSVLSSSSPSFPTEGVRALADETKDQTHGKGEKEARERETGPGETHTPDPAGLRSSSGVETLDGPAEQFALPTKPSKGRSHAAEAERAAAGVAAAAKDVARAAAVLRQQAEEEAADLARGERSRRRKSEENAGASAELREEEAEYGKAGGVKTQDKHGAGKKERREKKEVRASEGKERTRQPDGDALVTATGKKERNGEDDELGARKKRREKKPEDAEEERGMQDDRPTEFKEKKEKRKKMREAAEAAAAAKFFSPVQDPCVRQTSEQAETPRSGTGDEGSHLSRCQSWAHGWTRKRLNVVGRNCEKKTPAREAPWSLTEDWPQLACSAGDACAFRRGCLPQAAAPKRESARPLRQKPHISVSPVSLSPDAHSSSPLLELEECRQRGSAAPKTAHLADAEPTSFPEELASCKGPDRFTGRGGGEEAGATPRETARQATLWEERQGDRTGRPGGAQPAQEPTLQAPRKAGLSNSPKAAKQPPNPPAASSVSQRAEAQRKGLVQKAQKVKMERTTKERGKIQPWKRMQQWEEEWKRQKNWREKKLWKGGKRERSVVRQTLTFLARATGERRTPDGRETDREKGEGRAAETRSLPAWSVRTADQARLEKGTRETQATARTQENGEEQGEQEAEPGERMESKEAMEMDTREATGERTKAEDVDKTRVHRQDAERMGHGRDRLSCESGALDKEDEENKENNPEFQNACVRRGGEKEAEDLFPCSSTLLEEDKSGMSASRWMNSPLAVHQETAFPSNQIDLAVSAFGCSRPPAIAASLLAPFQWPRMFRSPSEREVRSSASLCREDEKELVPKKDTDGHSQVWAFGGRRVRAGVASGHRLPSSSFSATPSWGVHTPQRSVDALEGLGTRHVRNEHHWTAKKREKRGEVRRGHSAGARGSRSDNRRGTKAPKRERRRCSSCSSCCSRRHNDRDSRKAVSAKKDLKKAAEKAQKLERRLEALLQFAQSLRVSAPQFLWPGESVVNRYTTDKNARAAGSEELGNVTALPSGSPNIDTAHPNSSLGRKEQKTEEKEGGASRAVDVEASAPAVITTQTTTRQDGEDQELKRSENAPVNEMNSPTKPGDKTGLPMSRPRPGNTCAGGGDFQGGGLYIHPGADARGVTLDTSFGTRNRVLSASHLEETETQKRPDALLREEGERGETNKEIVEKGIDQSLAAGSGSTDVVRGAQTTPGYHGAFPHASRFVFSPWSLTSQGKDSAYTSLTSPREPSPIRPAAEKKARCVFASREHPAECFSEGSSGGAGEEREAADDSISPLSFLSSSSTSSLIFWDAVMDCVLAYDRAEKCRFERRFAWLAETEGKRILYENAPDSLKQLSREPYPSVRQRGETVDVSPEKTSGESASVPGATSPIRRSAFLSGKEKKSEGQGVSRGSRSCPGENAFGRTNGVEDQETHALPFPVDSAGEAKLSSRKRQVWRISGVRTPEFGGGDTAPGNRSVSVSSTRRRHGKQGDSGENRESAGDQKQTVPASPRVRFSTGASSFGPGIQSLKSFHMDSCLAITVASPLFVHNELSAEEIREIFSFRERQTAKLLTKEPLLRRQLAAWRKALAEHAGKKERKPESENEGPVWVSRRDKEGEREVKQTDEEREENELFRIHGSWSVREQLAEALLQEILKDGALDEIEDLVSQTVDALVTEEGSRAIALLLGRKSQ